MPPTPIYASRLPILGNQNHKLKSNICDRVHSKTADCVVFHGGRRDESHTKHFTLQRDF